MVPAESDRPPSPAHSSNSHANPVLPRSSISHLCKISSSKPTNLTRPQQHSHTQPTPTASVQSGSRYHVLSASPTPPARFDLRGSNVRSPKTSRSVILSAFRLVFSPGRRTAIHCAARPYDSYRSSCFSRRVSLSSTNFTSRTFNVGALIVPTTKNNTNLFPHPPTPLRIPFATKPHKPDTGHKSCLCISTTRYPSLLTHLLFGCSPFAYRENLVAPVKALTVESRF